MDIRNLPKKETSEIPELFELGVVSVINAIDAGECKECATLGEVIGVAWKRAQKDYNAVRDKNVIEVVS